MEIDCSLCIDKNSKDECTAESLYDNGTRIGYVPCKDYKDCYYKRMKIAEDKLKQIKALCNRYKTCRIVLKDDLLAIMEQE